MSMAIDPAVRDAAAWALVHSVWEFGVVALVAAAALACVPTSARLRYGISLVALLAMPLVVTATTCYFLCSSSPSAKEQARNIAPASLARAPVIVARDSAPASPSSAVRAAIVWQSRIDAHVSLILAFYLAGAGLCLLRLVLGSRYLLRLGRRSDSADPALQSAGDRIASALHLKRTVLVKKCVCIDSPAVIGFLRPMVLVPVCAITSMRPEEIEALIAHELAHVLRHDHIVNLLQSILEAALFYHPAVWWLSAQVRQEREHCCDDIAIGYTGERIVYAQALAGMESLRTRLPALALGARSGKLLPRIRRILGGREILKRRSLATRTLVFAATVAGLFLSAAALYTGCTPAIQPSHAGAPKSAPTGDEIDIDTQAYILPSARLAKIVPTSPAGGLPSHLPSTSVPGIDLAAPVRISGSIIDNYQRADLVKSLQADPSVTPVRVPAITIANDQSLTVQRDAAGDNAVAATDRPLLEQLPRSFHGVVSADHHYVILTVAQRGSSAATRPVTTMVSIPDGGTLLLFPNDATTGRQLLVLLRPHIRRAKATTTRGEESPSGLHVP